MRIATWNVNGIRARNAQVIDWIARDRPDVVCLQEIKAKPDQLPPLLFEPEGYWCHWHGAGGYSGVAIFVHKDLSATPPVFDRPAFDFETRLTTVIVNGIVIASAYVPNGGKDLYIDQDKFWKQFAADVTQAEARVMAVGQRPVTEAALNEPSQHALWKQVPSYFVYGTADTNIPAAALEFMAKRGNSRDTVVVKNASHVVMTSNPKPVADLIEKAIAEQK